MKSVSLEKEIFERLSADLRSLDSGRLDAKKIGEVFKVPVEDLALLCKFSPAELSESPDSLRVQSTLAPFERIARLRFLRQVDSARFREWVHSPVPDLGGETPAQLLLKGDGQIVADLVDNVIKGQFA